MSKIATKALIDEKITGNGVQAITGPILNNVLNTMVDDYGTQDEVSQLAQDVTDLDDEVYGNTEHIDEYSASAFTSSDVYSRPSGNPTTSATHRSTDFIEIPAEVTKIEAVCFGNSTYYFGVSFFSAQSSASFISGLDREDGTDNFLVTVLAADIPAGAKYIRVTGKGGDEYLSSCYVKIYSTQQTGSLKSRIVTLENEVADLYVDTPVQTETAIEIPNSFTLSKGVTYDTGALYDSSGYDASTYIDISGYTKIRYSRPKSTNPATGLGMAFYRANQSYISGQQAAIMSPADSYIDETLAVPNDAKYVRLSRNKNTGTWGNIYLYGIIESTQQVSRLDLMQDEIDELADIDGGTLVCDQMDIVERNVIISDGNYATDNDKGCTDFIPCAGAKQLTYTQIVGGAGAGLAFYDSAKQFISGSYVDSISGTNGLVSNIVDVPANAYYFRASGWNYANSKIYGEFSAVVRGTGICARGKRASNGESTFFSVVYNSAIDDLSVSDFSAASQADSPVCTTGVVLLPPSYSITGKPSRVIVTFHGWTHYVNYKQWGAPGSEYAGFLQQKQRWANAGYVVIDVNHKNSAQKGYYSGLGSKQDDECYRKAFEWVKQHYNVENECYIVCGSAGGPNGINACYNWPDVKAAVWLDTWIDIAENAEVGGCGTYYYGYTGSYDATKVGTRNPILRIKTIDGTNYLQMPQCPVKLYPLTNSAAFMTPFINIISAGNALGDFYVRQCSGITHSVLVSGGDGTDPQAEVVDNEIIRWCNQH